MEKKNKEIKPSDIIRNTSSSTKNNQIVNARLLPPPYKPQASADLEDKSKENLDEKEESLISSGSIEPPPYNNTGIPSEMKSNVEQNHNVDLSDVHVNYNSSKPEKFGAKAFTQNNNIELGKGEDSNLGHELIHVVQQKKGRVKETSQEFGQSINDDKNLEAEAENLGSVYTNSKMSSSSSSSSSKANDSGIMQFKREDRTISDSVSDESKQVDSNKQKLSKGRIGEYSRAGEDVDKKTGKQKESTLITDVQNMIQTYGGLFLTFTVPDAFKEEADIRDNQITSQGRSKHKDSMLDGEALKKAQKKTSFSNEKTFMTAALRYAKEKCAIGMFQGNVKTGVPSIYFKKEDIAIKANFMINYLKVLKKEGSSSEPVFKPEELKISRLAIFSHGLEKKMKGNGIAKDTQFTNKDIEATFNPIVNNFTNDIRIRYYACWTGKDTEEGLSKKTKEYLDRNDKSESIVIGHATRGHTLSNRLQRIFIGTGVYVNFFLSGKRMNSIIGILKEKFGIKKLKEVQSKKLRSLVQNEYGKVTWLFDFTPLRMSTEFEELQEISSSENSKLQNYNNELFILDSIQVSEKKRKSERVRIRKEKKRLKKHNQEKSNPLREKLSEQIYKMFVSYCLENIQEDMIK